LNYLCFYFNKKRPHPLRLCSAPSPTGEGFLGETKNDLIRFAYAQHLLQPEKAFWGNEKTTSSGSFLATCLSAARARFGSDRPPEGHSLPNRRLRLPTGEGFFVVTKIPTTRLTGDWD